jgi:trk system potassium uptake protein TrkA
MTSCTRVIYPKDITAEYILRFVRAKNNSIGSNIETMHEILDGKAEALEFHILENAPVANQTLETLDLKPEVLIACINRQGNIITPRGKDMLLPGDTVIVVTSRKGFTDIADILR